MRRARLVTARQRTAASAHRAWMRTVGMPIIREVVEKLFARITAELIAEWEASVTGEIERIRLNAETGATDEPTR